jgi:flagellar hook protein FlgE
MSLNAALNSAVSGLTAQSTALSVISANIANASTTGYKTADTTFDTLVAESSANLTSTVGEGVTTAQSQEMSAQGEVSSTTTSTNMAVNGTGFFVASASTANTSPGTDIYTRNGSWTQDANGYLINTSGDYLMGYPTDASGNVSTASGGTLAGLTAIKIPATTTVTPSTTATLVANLPAELATAGTVTTVNGVSTTATGQVTSSSDVVDSLGVTQQIGQTWTKTGTDAAGNTTWTLALAAPTSTSDTSVATGTVSPNSATLVFNNSGVLVSSSQTSAAGVVTADATAGDLTGITLTLNSGATSTFALNLSGMTQTASAANDGKISITSSSSDGSTAGALSNVAVATNGDVTATYSNGANVIVAKVPLATFANQNGLTELNGSTYAATLASGSATLSAAGTNGAGKITGEALEASNTDTASEFNKMIVAQQAYSAAAQVVTYVDKMFESLIQAVG